MPDTKNVSMRVEGEKLIIEVDLTKRFGTSKTGKSEIVASATLPVDGHPGVVAGVNVYAK